jgi:hypothetical protein
MEKSIDNVYLGDDGIVRTEYQSPFKMGIMVKNVCFFKLLNLRIK